MTRQKIMIDYDRVDRTQSLLRYPLPTGLQLNAIFFDFCDHLFSMQQNSDASSAQMKMMLPTKNTAAEIMLNAPGIFEAAPDFRDIYTSSFCSQSYSIQNSIHDCTIHSSRQKVYLYHIQIMQHSRCVEHASFLIEILCTFTCQLLFDVRIMGTFK